MARPTAPEPYSALNVYLYDAQREWIERQARQRGVSRSVVMRELVDQARNEICDTPPSPPSCC